MRVLLVGSTGFLGGAIHTALEHHDHEVAPLRRDQGYDLKSPSSLDTVASQLSGVEGIVVAAGHLTDDGERAARLTRGVIALLDRAAAAEIPNLVLISSIGARPEAPIASLRGKAEQEDTLLAHRQRKPGLNWTIVRPSLVCGPGGTSSRLFASLATLPLRLRIRSGPLRPIHVDDLAEGVVGLLVTSYAADAIVEACGPDRIDLEGYVQAFEQHGRQALAVPVPDVLVELVFRLTGLLRLPMANSGVLQALRAGADGDPTALSKNTGVKPRSLGSATSGLTPTSPVLRWLLVLGLALFWIWSGLSSIAFWPIGQSAAMARQAGVPDGLAVASVYTGGIIDIAIGAAMLPRATQYMAALAATAVTIGYVAIMTVGTPDLWFHPLGPIAKGLPLAAAAIGLAMLAKAEPVHSKKV